MKWKRLTAIEFTLTIVGICYISYGNAFKIARCTKECPFINFTGCNYRLLCLSCNKAANINDCSNTMAQCSDGSEECFLDWQVLPDLSAVLTAGCRATHVCNLLSNAFGKRITQRSVGCSQCCNSPPNGTQVPCNGYLCKQAPVAKHTCGVCDSVSDPKDCAVDQSCSPVEACKINTIFTGGFIKFELGCEQKTVSLINKNQKQTPNKKIDGKHVCMLDDVGYAMTYEQLSERNCDTKIKFQVCDVLLKEYKRVHITGTGKRGDHGDLVLCSACCDGIGCNKDQCRNLIKIQPCFNSAICG